MFDLGKGVWTALDVAGGAEGGAARWRGELDGYLAARTPAPVRVVGRGQHLSMRWMLARERAVKRSPLVIAANNVSFAVAGSYRVVLARNALHFLYAHEEHLLGRMSAGWRKQIPLVRSMLRRADEIVVPCEAMAKRITRIMPEVAARIVVRMHPVTPVPAPRQASQPFILVPVVPGPYKNLFPELRSLVTALTRLKTSTQVRVTAERRQLPEDIARMHQVTPIGARTHQGLVGQWRTASAVFYPSIVESFGYPLAEARANGIPVIAPDSQQAREIAGKALRAYVPSDWRTLAAAIELIGEPLDPEPEPFHPGRYFDRLLGIGVATGIAGRWSR